jgi:hypothetical protein
VLAIQSPTSRAKQSNPAGPKQNWIVFVAQLLAMINYFDPPCSSE